MSAESSSAAEPIERDSLPYYVVIIGAGPAGLSAAIRLRQLAIEKGAELSVAVLEKGSEVGAHILSGAVIDPRALNELLPDWRERGSPLDTPVTEDKFLFLGEQGALPLPGFVMPAMIHNHGMFVGSLGEVCRWLAREAEALGVEIYPGFAGAALIHDETGAVKGVQVGDLGIGRDGQARAGAFTPGIEIHAKYTLIAEGVRGSLAKQVIGRFKLDDECEPQKYGIGIKELWKIAPENHRPGYVQHSFGWPLDNRTGGGSFLYHFGDNFVSVGFVVHLNYRNPWISPFDEFQRFKHHPEIRRFLAGGKRIAYGARAITEGGYQSVPKLVFPGGALIGCAAGFVNLPRIKGSHNAMKTGMMAAEAAFDAIAMGRQLDSLDAYQTAYEHSWVHEELRKVRNAKPLWSRFGTVFGAIALTGLDLWTNTLFNGFSFFGTLGHKKSDAESTESASRHKPIPYPKPDGVLSFDKLSSVFQSSTNHEEDQPIHLRLTDPDTPIRHNLPEYAEPAQRYCPAGVYEVLYDAAGANPRFQINAQNCVHCKTCDIKDPTQNIVWTTPEGGGGPNYPNM